MDTIDDGDEFEECEFGGYEYLKAKIRFPWTEKYAGTSVDKLFTYYVDGDSNLHDWVIVDFRDRIDFGEIEELSFDTIYSKTEKKGKSYAIGKSYKSLEEAKLGLREIHREERESWLKKMEKNTNKDYIKTYDYYVAAFQYEKTHLEKSIEMYESMLAANYNATSSPYDRLIILYKKKKQYADAIKVVEKAIQIFGSDDKFKNSPIPNRFRELLGKLKK